MRYYEYDAQGWLIGGYNAENARPASTPIDFAPIPGIRARWVNGAWTIDTTREQQQAADETAERTRRQQAIAILKAYNPNTATAAEVRAAVGAQNILLREIIHELRTT